jgi:hypothetical protein
MVIVIEMREDVRFKHLFLGENRNFARGIHIVNCAVGEALQVDKPGERIPGCWIGT